MFFNENIRGCSFQYFYFLFFIFHYFLMDVCFHKKSYNFRLNDLCLSDFINDEINWLQQQIPYHWNSEFNIHKLKPFSKLFIHSDQASRLREAEFDSSIEWNYCFVESISKVLEFLYSIIHFFSSIYLCSQLFILMSCSSLLLHSDLYSFIRLLSFLISILEFLFYLSIIFGLYFDLAFQKKFYFTCLH